MFGNLDDFEEEPDFTRSNPSEGCSEPATAEFESTKECDQLPYKYNPDDLVPKGKDPSCKADWFLASYWPVYVSNFRVGEWLEETWYEQVSDYFAYNGLLTRMIYIHHQHDDMEFAKYQQKCLLIDMLVYFTSEAEAERAIATCNRDSYYGYKLNVLPGRRPVFLDHERSVRFIHLDACLIYKPLETIIEYAVAKHGPVTFATRCTNQTVVIEFVTTEAMVAGVAGQMSWKPAQVQPGTMKQRFLEEDVKMNIEWAKESNPKFMDMQPKASVLLQLFEGIRPNVNTPWKGHDRYVRGPIWNKRRADWKQRMKTLRKRRERKKAAKDKTEVVSRDPPVPPAKTKRQKEADNIKSINWFLAQYGASAVSKTEVREARNKVEKQKQAKPSPSVTGRPNMNPLL